MSFVNPPLLFPLRLHVSLLPAVSHPSHRTQPGLVLVLGQGDVGQLGLGQDVMERKKPALVQLPELMVQVEAGGMHTVCLSETGKVSALWGFVGSWGGLSVPCKQRELGCVLEQGLNHTSLCWGCSLPPPSCWMVMTAADLGIFGVRRDHSACWVPRLRVHPVELRCPILTAALSLQIYTFGCNDEGALGRDTSEEGSECTPGPVELQERVVQVSAGDSHTAALTDDGRVFIWGSFRVRWLFGSSAGGCWVASGTHFCAPLSPPRITTG